MTSVSRLRRESRMDRVYNNRTNLTLSQRLATYQHATRLEDIDPAARQRAKEIIAYHVSIAFRSLYERLPEAGQIVAAAKILSDSGGRSTLIGHRDKVTLVDAALANCTMMRATGLDDVILP